MINQRQGVSTLASLNRPRKGRPCNSQGLGLKQQKVSFGESDGIADRTRHLATKVAKLPVYDPSANKGNGKFVPGTRYADSNFDSMKPLDDVLDWREMFHTATLAKRGFEKPAPVETAIVPNIAPNAKRAKQSRHPRGQRRPSADQAQEWLIRYKMAASR